MQTFRLTLEYDGTGFAGWQRQPGRRTVAGELDRAVRTLDRTAEPTAGAGRTDAGVHAAGQVARIRLRWAHGASRLLLALNSRLPEDVAVRAARPAPDVFDPRRDAVARAYRYTILTGPARSPFLRAASWHVPDPLDVPAMRRAAAMFRGTHDFAVFTTEAARARETVRHVTGCRLAARGGLLLLDVTGPGFLHRMVRLLTGAIVKAGRGLTPARIRQVLQAGRGGDPVADAAPPQGLCLLGVRYPGDPPPRPAGWPPGLQ